MGKQVNGTAADLATCFGCLIWVGWIAGLAYVILHFLCKWW